MSDSAITSPPLMTGMALGGVLISALGAGSTLYVEHKKPTTKSVLRDFIIGAVMVAMIIQLLPESSAATIQFVLGLVPLALFQRGGRAEEATEKPTSSGIFGGLLGGGTAVITSSTEPEVKVGVPRF